MQPFII